MDAKAVHGADKEVFEILNPRFLSGQSSSLLGGSDATSLLGKIASQPRELTIAPVLLGKGSSSPSLCNTASTMASSESAVAMPTLTGPLFNKESSLSNMNLETLRISSRSGDLGAGSGDLDESSKFNIMESLFSNWPAIVMTILGFNPSISDTGADNPSPTTFSSVHMLDSFTTDLLLNCSSHMIDGLVETIVRHVNTAAEQARGHPRFLDLFLQDVDYTDPEVVPKYLEAGEGGVAVLVGRRFLGSVVRVLALEHSRVKNRFLEMQQQVRQSKWDTHQVGLFIHQEIIIHTS